MTEPTHLTVEELEIRERISALTDWLDNEAEKLAGNAISREEPAKCMVNATRAELKAAKAMSERMAGRKLPDVSTEPDSARDYGEMQDRIAKKLDAQSKQLSAWADVIRDIPRLLDSLEAARRELADSESLTRQLEKATMPCGHLDRYGYSENGGANIVCTLCELGIPVPLPSPPAAQEKAAWCSVCDRSKSDCACVENGGTY